MKFCPICKQNHDTEDTACPNCGQELLTGNIDETSIVFEYSNEELVLKLFNHLCEQRFTSVQYFTNSENGMCSITVSNQELFQIQNSILDYIDENKENQFSQSEQNAVIEYISSSAREMTPDEGAKTFINAKEKYNDLMSSAFSLLVVGILGLVFIALVYFKIIKFEVTLLFYLLGLVMFGMFIITGIITFFRAKNIKKEIPTEQTLTDEIKNYLLNEYVPLANAQEEDGPSQEELYFSRSAHMKTLVQEHFKEADELLIEGMIEEVYNNIYPD